MQRIQSLMNYGVKGTLLFFFIFSVNVSSSLIIQEVRNDANHRVINLSLMAMQFEEDQQNDLYSSKQTFSGDLTGYSANCPYCNGTLACQSMYNVLDGTESNMDNDYGLVRIVASSSNLPCGSIVRFQVSKLSEEPILAIVLDRGVVGTNLDLLTSTEISATKYVGRINITYDVLRSGWIHN